MSSSLPAPDAMPALADALADQIAESARALGRHADMHRTLNTQLEAQNQKLQQLLVSVNHAYLRLVATHAIAETDAWTLLETAIRATVDRWCAEQPGLSRPSAFLRVENALKWEYRTVLADAATVPTVPYLPALPGDASLPPLDPDHHYWRLRLRNLPVPRLADALAFLKTLPPPDPAGPKTVRAPRRRTPCQPRRDAARGRPPTAPGVSSASLPSTSPAHA